MGQKTLLLGVSLLLVLVALPAIGQQADTPPDTRRDEREVNLQFQVGFNALTDGNLPKARRRFERAVASDTAIPRAYYWLGKTYFYQGFNDSAVRILQRAETFPEVRDIAEREIKIHRLRYRSDTFSFHHEWNYVGLIEGNKHDESRNINPSALEGDPSGGWFSSSYREGKILKYSEEGRVLRTWGGFKTPTDIQYRPGLGLLVAELEPGRVSLLTDTGSRRTFTTTELVAPTQLFISDSSLYVVESGEQRIVQLTPGGDTAGVVWDAPSNVSLTDVSVGPEGNFWVLDDQEYQFHVVSPAGVVLETHSWNRNLDLRKIWWRRGQLMAVGTGGIVSLKTDDFQARPLSAQGDTLPGADVSDVHFTGDRMIISSFESSELLIYRPPNVPDPDLLVDQRRFDFSDFPVVRGNLILEDPLRSHRFEHLRDKNLGIDVNGYDILPSVLRHTKKTYGNDWILLVDNRISNLRAWEEVRPFLEKIVNRSPDGTKGSLWTVTGSSVIAQSFTSYPTVIENALNQVKFYSTPDGDRGDTLLARRLNQAFRTLFARRSSGGIIVLTRNAEETASGLRRIANRAMNNSTPVFVINPSARSLSEDNVIARTPAMYHQNFGNLNVRRLWERYRSYQNHHYTVIYRSNLRYQASSLWRNFEFSFHYFDRVYRYQGGFLIP